MFYGLDKSPEPETLARLSTMTGSVRTCSPGRKCVGSMDGKTFSYANAPDDTGVLRTSKRATHEGHVYRWVVP